MSEKELTSQLCSLCNFNPCDINQNRLAFLQSADVEFFVFDQVGKMPCPWAAFCEQMPHSGRRRRVKGWESIKQEKRGSGRKEESLL